MIRYAYMLRSVKAGGFVSSLRSMVFFLLDRKFLDYCVHLDRIEIMALSLCYS